MTGSPDGSPVGSAAGEVTGLLQRLEAGDRSAADRLYPLVYEALREVAGRALAREADGHTLQRTELVHEVYLRLAGSAGVHWHDRAHFLAVAARVMRQVLVDHARRRLTARRGGGELPRELDAVEHALAATVPPPDDLVALDDALGRLERLSPRLRTVVECRFFGGLADREIAHALGVTERTVQRDWVRARAWLHQAMDPAG